LVGHQAVPEDIQGEPGAGVDDGLDEGVIVPGLVEDRLAAVAAVENVLPLAANGGSGSSWHAIMVKQVGLAVSIGYVPISPARVLTLGASSESRDSPSEPGGDRL
jgi:hypothetical protein